MDHLNKDGYKYTIHFQENMLLRDQRYRHGIEKIDWAYERFLDQLNNHESKNGYEHN